MAATLTANLFLLLLIGLIVHDPDPENKPPIPYYSLVRLSATPTNLDWYQTNLPEGNLPQWVEDIGDQHARLVSRSAALYGVDSDFESDSENGDDRTMQEAPPAQAEPVLQVHPYRFRLWVGACQTCTLTGKYLPMQMTSLSVSGRSPSLLRQKVECGSGCTAWERTSPA
jgi:hypothetical protein